MERGLRLTSVRGNDSSGVPSMKGPCIWLLPLSACAVDDRVPGSVRPYAPTEMGLSAGEPEEEADTATTPSIASHGDALAVGVHEPESPFGAELVDNGGFEEGAFDPWSVAEGACQVVGPTDLSWAVAAVGDGFVHGGTPAEATDCRVVQEIDLAAEGFALRDIDDGRAMIVAQAWLASPLSEGSFDDQSSLWVTFVDEAGQELSAVRTLSGSADFWRLRTTDGLVPPGTRLLRVELEGRHRLGASNDGLFDEISVVLQEAVSGPAAFTLDPVLQDARTDSMRLLWETDGNLDENAVEWGVAGGALDRESTDVVTTRIRPDRYVHVAEMTGLTAGTTYEYRVRSGENASESWRFRSAPEPGSDVRIAWLADTQDGPEVFSGHVLHMAGKDPDMLVAVGDLIHNGWPTDDQEGYLQQAWHDQWFAPLETESFAQTTPVLAARGNHDAEHALAYAYTALPGNEAWYSFTYGNIFFVVLDTQASPSGETAPIDQETFVREALSSAEAQAAEWRIVAYHIPPYTNTRHDNWSTGWVGQQQGWLTTFQQYDVDIVASGHMHSYQRGANGDGIRYVIVGGGGAEVDDQVMDLYSFLDVVELTWHYAILETEGRTLTWTAYDTDDVVIDRFEIQH